MQQWEYNLALFDIWDFSVIGGQLNNLGKEGWEIVSVKYPPTPHQKEDRRGAISCIIIFKRPIT